MEYFAGNESYTTRTALNTRQLRRPKVLNLNIKTEELDQVSLKEELSLTGTFSNEAVMVNLETYT